MRRSAVPDDGVLDIGGGMTPGHQVRFAGAPLELAVVLRSWEDRFGVRLLKVGHDDIRLLVSRPPQDLQTCR
jgi:Domain of unknown function (DUF4253)